MHSARTGALAALTFSVLSFTLAGIAYAEVATSSRHDAHGNTNYQQNTNSVHAPSSTVLSSHGIDMHGVNQMTHGATIPEDRGHAPVMVTPQTQTLFVGTATNVHGPSFTLLSDGAQYEVHVSNGYKLWDMNRHALEWTRVHDGDSVRIMGSLIGNIIYASIVRDTSR